MRFLLLVILFLYASVTFADDCNHTGVFSNKAEGFYTVTVIVHKDGLAFFNAALSGQIGEWEFDTSASKLSLKFFDLSTMMDQSLSIPFDAKTRSYTFNTKGEESSGNSTNRLYFISDDIPEKLIEAFKTYPARLREAKARAIAEREWNRRVEEQMERERPEYERILSEIRENPESMLSPKFYVREETPATRAFKTCLKDSKFEYPEKILVGLLESLPEDNHWIRSMIFSRAELQSNTLRQFYPRALEWGKLNYTILANIAAHPNTPPDVIKDLARRDDLPVGATNPAKEQLEIIERKQNNE